MSAKLSPAVIVTGPKDDLLANDGRGTTPAGTISKMKPAASPAAVGTLAANAKPLKRNAIENALLKKIKNPGISSDQALKSLEQSIGTRLVTLYGAATEGASAANLAVSAFQNDLTGRDPTRMADVSGRVIDIWDRADPTKVTSLSRAIQTITRDVSGTGLIDTKGKFAAALGLLDTALALGVPQLIDDIIQYVKVNKESKRRLIESVRQVIMRSDLKTLNKILDLVGSAGVLQRVPDAIALILTFYRFSWGTTPDQYPARRHELLNTLGRIKSDWSTSLRGNTAVSDLTQTNYMSPASKTLLTLIQPGTTDSNYFEQPYLLEALMAGSYPFQPLQQLSKTLYPELAAWGGG